MARRRYSLRLVVLWCLSSRPLVLRIEKRITRVRTRGREYELLSPWLESDGCVWRRMENCGFYGFEAVTEMELEAKVPYCGISNLLAHALVSSQTPADCNEERSSKERRASYRRCCRGTQAWSGGEGRWCR